MGKSLKKALKSRGTHREPLTSDIIFKAVFGQDNEESKAALIEMLNLVLDRADDPIVDITYKNPFSIAEDAVEKTIIMDISVETSRNELIDVEMQIGEMDAYIDRSVYYACKQLAKGLEKGDDYDKIKKSIVISFIKDKLFPDEFPVHSVFSLREDFSSAQLSKLIELHYVELGKIRRDIADPCELDPMEQLGAYIRYAGDPEQELFVETLVGKGVKVISMADKVLKKVSEEERLQYMRQSREMAELQIRMEKRMANEKGMEQGIEQGRQKEKLENAIKMKELGITTEQIMQVTGLSEKEIAEL